MKRIFTYGFLLLGLAVLGSSDAQAASQTITADVENFGAADGDPAFFAGTVNVASVTLSLPAITSFDTIDMELAHAYLSDIEFKLTSPTGEFILITYEDEIIASGAHDDRNPLGNDGSVDPLLLVENSQNSGDKAILLTQTVLYTLDPTASAQLNDHFGPPNFSDPNPPLPAGSYRTGEPKEGDYDLDLDVDGADFLFWQSTYPGFLNPGRSLTKWQDNYADATIPEAVWPTGSFPAGDWTLTITDGYSSNDPGSLGDVTFNYTLVPTTSAVPEPGSACLLLAGCTLLGLTRRKLR